MTAGFTVKTIEDKKALRGILDRYRNRNYKETPLLDEFNSIASIIANSYDQDVFKAKLLVIYDVLMRKEQEKKPPQYTHTS